MAAHRYKVGQSLNFSAGRMGHMQPDRACKVTRLLPVDEGGIPQYRIQCTSEAIERVTNESNLSRRA